MEYSAEDVREQIRARAVLEWRGRGERLEAGGDGGDGPKLMDEDEAIAAVDLERDENDGDKWGEFVLHFDGMVEARQRLMARMRVGAQHHLVDDKEKEGLRRRGNAASSSGEILDSSTEVPNKWTTEKPLDEEEELLRNADPLCLFGVPPPALRIAQTKARDATAYYVEVANVAMEIMRITQE